MPQAVSIRERRSRSGEPPGGLPPAPAAAEHTVRGRGSASNPTNRFERLHYDIGDVGDAGGAPSETRTLYLRDPTRSAIAFNESPDVGFNASINPYRGCEHGCIYCYARPTHEYLGFSAGLDFETRILVKERLPELLRKALSSKSWQPQVLGMSGVTDPYQPIERRIELTRRCLRVLTEFRNPVAIITKNALIARDRDLLGELAEVGAASATLSITTLDPVLQRQMEPRACHPERRLETIRKLAAAGIPVGVNVAPVVPGLTDHEIPRILEAAACAGATRAGHIVLRLPHGVANLFSDWLAAHRPERRDKILHRTRALRDGRLDDPRFGSRMRGSGIFAEQIHELFALACRKHGLTSAAPELSTRAFRRPDPHGQLALFGSD